MRYEVWHRNRARHGADTSSEVYSDGVYKTLEEAKRVADSGMICTDSRCCHPRVQEVLPSGKRGEIVYIA